LLTQIAKARGATVISTVSTSAKAELSKGAGADHVLNYTEVDFKDEARKLTGGRGVDVVYDSVGKTTFDKSLESIRTRGLLALFGASSGPVPPFELQRLSANGSLFITRPTLFNYISDPADLARRAGDLFAAVASGALKVRIGHRYPLADAARAHTDLEARATTGKLLLIP
jgi:NADPH2:quinone reductase